MFLKKLSAVSLAAVLALSLAACGKKEGVAAEVGGVEIPMEDYYKSYAARTNQLKSQYGEDILNQEDPESKKSTDELLREQTMQDLTETEMIRQDAEKLGIKVTEEDANKEIENVKAQIGGEEAYQAFLKQNNMPEDFLKENLMKQKMASQYTEKKLAELKPTDEEMKKYYEDNKNSFYKAKASHILVSDLKEANVIRKEILKGGDFAKIAKEKSLDTASGKNGGELGEFTNGQMVPQFDDAIAKMKVGDISEPIQSNYGYHVIKLEEKKGIDFDKAKPQIETTMQQNKFKDYLEKLRKDSKIKLYVNTKEEVNLPEEYKNYGVIEAPKSSQETKETNAKNNSANNSKKVENAKNNSNKEQTNTKEK
ncbi:foldase protein PrsA [Peptoniphilus olsenii]|uniref:peptidylprolyl isomerase n=1 Tax=Peptoniphilus olsenii TaxID=411570 RepID=A0ABV2JAV9_9FIRM